MRTDEPIYVVSMRQPLGNYVPLVAFRDETTAEAARTMIAGAAKGRLLLAVGPCVLVSGLDDLADPEAVRAIALGLIGGGG